MARIEFVSGKRQHPHPLGLASPAFPLGQLEDEEASPAATICASASEASVESETRNVSALQRRAWGPQKTG